MPLTSLLAQVRCRRSRHPSQTLGNLCEVAYRSRRGARRGTEGALAYWFLGQWRQVEGFVDAADSPCFSQRGPHRRSVCRALPRRGHPHQGADGVSHASASGGARQASSRRSHQRAGCPGPRLAIEARGRAAGRLAWWGGCKVDATPRLRISQQQAAPSSCERSGACSPRLRCWPKPLDLR